MEGNDDSLEQNSTKNNSNKKISIPNEKILNHSMRNKRKSKIFKRKDSTVSNAEIESNESNDDIIDEIKNKGNLFDDIKFTKYLNEGEKFMSTLEQFELLTVNDTKENINCNLLEAIIKINEESKLNSQPLKLKNLKTNYSQRFKDTSVLDYMLIKKYKN